MELEEAPGTNESLTEPTVQVYLTPLPLEDPALLAMIEEGSKMVAWAEQLDVVDHGSAKRASEDLSVIAGVKERMKDKKKEYTAPVRQLLTDINTAFDKVMDAVTRADTLLRGKVSRYLAEEKRKEEEAAQIVRDQIALVERARALEDSGGEAVELEAAEVTVTAAPVRVRSDIGLVSRKANWKARVTDFSILPDDYKLPDMVTLNALAKKHHDGRKIPGVDFYNDETIQVRR